MAPNVPRRLIRRQQVEALSGLRQTSIWEREQAGLFPPRIKLSTRMNVWPEDEVAAVNTAIIAGKSEGDLRELVKQLVAARSQASAA